MAYTITLTNGTTFATITDGTVNTASSMTLVGKNYAGYGQFLDENFIHLLENSANATAPASPLTGQIWWDSANTLLKVYSGGGGWKVVGGATASSSQPSPSVVGDLWYDTVNQQLKVCSVAGSPGTFIVVGPAYSNSQGTSGAIPLTISDGTTGYVVTGLYANNNLVGIISAAADFVPAGNSSAYAATFPRIYRGFTVYNSGNASGNISNPGNIGLAVGGSVIETIASTGAFFTGVSSASGNVIGANLVTGGLITATGNIVSAANVTGANITTGGLITATGNVSGGNLRTAGLVTVTGNITGGNLLTGGLASVTGNITGGNLITGGLASVTGNITGGNLLFGSGIVTGTGNVIGGNVLFGTGNVSGTGNVAAGYFIGNGSQLTGLSSAVSVTKIENGTSVVQIGASGGNANVTIGGTSNVAVFTNTGAVFTGLTTPSVDKSGTNAVGNIGSTSNYFNRIFVTTTVGTTVSVTGNIDSGNIGTVGLITATGNISGGNLRTSGIVSATGNIITAGYFVGTFSGNISGNLTVPGSNTQVLFNNSGNAGASANFTFDSATNALLVTGTGSVTGNVTGGNILTGGLISAASTITGTTITGSTLSSTGNVNMVGIVGTGNISTTGNISGGNILGGSNVNATTHTGFTVSVTGNVTGGNILTGGLISASGNITGGNILGGANVNATTHTGSTVSVTGNIDAGNLRTVGLVSATGNITGNFILGNGSLLSGISTSVSKIFNGTSEANIGTSGGNANISIGGTSNVAVFANTGILVTGIVSASGNVSGSNLNTAGVLSVNSGNSSGTVIVNAGGNTVGNIGSTTSYFGNAHITSLRALYADVAERFAADEVLEPGTVVELGGTAEITKSRHDLSENVFGVISTKAAYLMNGAAGEDNTHPPVAMTGRVPVQVIGKICKGDRLVSAGNGQARAACPGEATAFNVIGRSLVDKNTEGPGSVEAIVTIK